MEPGENRELQPVRGEPMSARLVQRPGDRGEAGAAPEGARVDQLRIGDGRVGEQERARLSRTPAIAIEPEREVGESAAHGQRREVRIEVPIRSLHDGVAEALLVENAFHDDVDRDVRMTRKVHVEERAGVGSLVDVSFLVGHVREQSGGAAQSQRGAARLELRGAAASVRGLLRRRAQAARARGFAARGSPRARTRFRGARAPTPDRRTAMSSRTRGRVNSRREGSAPRFQSDSRSAQIGCVVGSVSGERTTSARAVPCMVRRASTRAAIDSRARRRGRLPHAWKRRIVANLGGLR